MTAGRKKIRYSSVIIIKETFVLKVMGMRGSQGIFAARDCKKEREERSDVIYFNKICYKINKNDKWIQSVSVFLK